MFLTRSLSALFFGNKFHQIPYVKKLGLFPKIKMVILREIKICIQKLQFFWKFIFQYKDLSNIVKKSSQKS